jgi:hypothetical protein
MTAANHQFPPARGPGIRQPQPPSPPRSSLPPLPALPAAPPVIGIAPPLAPFLSLNTSDAADDSLRVDLGGRRIIKKIF